MLGVSFSVITPTEVSEGDFERSVNFLIIQYIYIYIYLLTSSLVVASLLVSSSSPPPGRSLLQSQH